MKKEEIIKKAVLPVFKAGFQHPPMKTTAQLLARYGNPISAPKIFIAKWITLWTVPEDIRLKIPLPFHFEINKDIQVPLEKTYRALITKGFHTEIKTWDGCFVIRTQRYSDSISMHSFALALDHNSRQNPLNGKVTWTEGFLNVWRAGGWICGADFHSRTDGMHFEYTAATDW